MWAQNMNVELKTVVRWFISFTEVLQECFVLSSGSRPAYCRDVSQAKIVFTHSPLCCLRLYSQPWVVTLHFFPRLLFHSHCFKHFNTLTDNSRLHLDSTGPFTSIFGSKNNSFFPSPHPQLPLYTPHTPTVTHCMTRRCLQDKIPPIAPPCPYFHSWVKFWVAEVNRNDFCLVSSRCSEWKSWKMSQFSLGY